MSQPISNTNEDYSYTLLTKPRSHQLGTRVLLIGMEKASSHTDFTPEVIEIRLQTQTTSVFRLGLTLKRKGSSFGRQGWVTLDQKTNFPEERCVYPSYIHLRDHQANNRQFYTFGGTLRAIDMPYGRAYALYSPTPILTLTGEAKNMTDRLASQAERLFDQYEAHWGQKRCSQHVQQPQQTAWQLYLASLTLIAAGLEQEAALRQAYIDCEASWFKKYPWSLRHYLNLQPILTLADSLFRHAS